MTKVIKMLDKWIFLLKIAIVNASKVALIAFIGFKSFNI
jgi:hypothetical protein